MDCTNHVTKTKALISCAVTTQLICAYVFAYAKCQFPYDAESKKFPAANIKSENAYPIRGVQFKRK